MPDTAVAIGNVGRRRGSIRIEVDRVGPELTSQAFASTYYEAQIPVVVAGVADAWLASRLWTARYVFEKLRGAAVEKAYNLDIDGDHELARQCALPPAIAAILNRPSVIVPAVGSRDPHRGERAGEMAQPHSLRIWISGAGTHTPWHYDGNSLQVANVQVRGRKRWSLVSPETPLTCFRFSQAARAGYADVTQIRGPIRFAVCETHPGDLIFIPQHWYHSVVSLDDQNINVNWVWTDWDRLMTSRTAAAIREREYLATLYWFDRVYRGLRGSAPWSKYLETYGGSSGFALTRELARVVPLTAVVKRSLLEVGRSVLDGPSRRRRMRDELRLNSGVRRTAYDYFVKANRDYRMRQPAGHGPRS